MWLKENFVFYYTLFFYSKLVLATGSSYPPPTTYTYSDYTFTVTPEPIPSAIITLPPDPKGIAEVDIVFPRDGGTYPQLEPFPVIFALQHPEVLYKYGFYGTWSLESQTPCEVDSDDYPYCLDYPSGSISSGADSGFPVPEVINDDTIFAFDNGTSLKPGVWEMAWEFDISQNCDDLYIVININPSGLIASGTVTFTIDDTASMPTFTSSCPAVAGMVNFFGTIKATLADGDIFQGCPATLTSPLPASAKPCDATLNAAQGSSISKALGLSIAVITPTLPPTSITPWTPTMTSNTAAQSSVTLTSEESESTTGFSLHSTRRITVSSSQSTTRPSLTSTLTVTPSGTTTSNGSFQKKPSALLVLAVVCLSLLIAG